MRISMMLWLCVMAIQTTVIAQSNKMIKPSDLVKAHQEALDAKTPENIFNISPNREGLDLETYEIFNLNEEKTAAIQYEAPEEMRLEIPRTGRDVLVLELVKVNMNQPTVIESASQAPVNIDHAVHYRGIVSGDDQSIVALSIVEGEIMALVSSNQLGGNWVLAKLPETESRNNMEDIYTFYQDTQVFQRENFSCSTPDSGQAYDTAELRDLANDGARDLSDCVQVYLEVNYDIYQDKGSTQAAVQYITALFNQVATLYANEQINMTVSEIYVWNTPSSYTSNSSGQMLTDFQTVRTSFNGDIAQLVSYQASGGIAVVDGLCHSFTLAKMSYAGIHSTFQQVPTYSWSVMVMAHELGHLLGSQHTHACVWNGNGTALDACPGYTEGGCGNPAPPTNGGTVMSYCHLSQIGINLSLGFGTQPGNLIRNKVSAATCLVACSTSGGNGGNGGGNGGGTGGGNGNDASCQQEQVILRLLLDTYSPETSWTLKNTAGTIVAQGGPYSKTLANQWVLDTFCLPQACYTFQINDAYNDGICCDFGQGSYTLLDAQQNILSQGGEFTNMEQSSFCVPFDTGGGSGGGDCLTIDFSQEQVIPYGLNQDRGQFAVQDNGQTLYLANNAWKAIMMNYEVTPNTKISFDFKSTRQGEIHGIGFDNNDNISFGYTFRVFGIQNWGISDYDNYPANNNWKSYTIPVGQFYTGTADRLFFSTDHDGGARNGNSWFRNVRIFEGEGCNGNIIDPATQGLQSTNASLGVFPNPVVDGQVNFRVDETGQGHASWEILTLTGQSLLQRNVSTDGFSFEESLSVDHLPKGTYLIKWQDKKGTKVARFNLQ